MTLVKGRRMSERLTHVLAEEAKVEPQDISLAIVEVEAEAFAEGGELALDRRQRLART